MVGAKLNKHSSFSLLFSFLSLPFPFLPSLPPFLSFKKFNLVSVFIYLLRDKCTFFVPFSLSLSSEDLARGQVFNFLVVHKDAGTSKV